MIEVKGDLWDLSKGHFVCVTTNGQIKSNNANVMGKGVAKEAADHFPQLPFRLGECIIAGGNHVYFVGAFDDWKVLSFPTKNHWRENSSLELIEQSVRELDAFMCWNFEFTYKVFLPRPGCGNGNLDWNDVKPLLEKLDDNFYVVSK